MSIDTSPGRPLVPASPRPEALAVVRAAIAPLHAEPRVSSAQTSQALAGHVLLVHETRGDWLLAAGVDGYRGWVHRGYLVAAPSAGALRALGVPVSADVAAVAPPWAPEPAWALARETNDDARRVSLGCVVRVGRGPAMALPLGARVRDAADVVEGRAVPREELPRLHPADPAAIAHSAREYFAGTSYQWGGVTPWGADCSGLVQSVFRLHGVELPRDAWQQALVGDDAGADLAALRPADLLFFSDRDDRRITHVGLSLGGALMVHLALGRGGYAADRLDDLSDDYAARLAARFVVARRVVPTGAPAAGR